MATKALLVRPKRSTTIDILDEGVNEDNRKYSTTEMAVEPSKSSGNRKKSLTSFTKDSSTFNTATPIVEESNIARKSYLKKHSVICSAMLSVFCGKLLIPILVALVLAFQMKLVDEWPHEWEDVSLEVAECTNDQSASLRAGNCECVGIEYASSDGNVCSVPIGELYIDLSFALNAMVLIVEFLWFIRMLYGLTRFNLCDKLSLFEAVAEQTRDSKCCMFGWRVFELIWYIVIVQQMNYLQCKCLNDGDLKWTERGRFYQYSFYLDLTVMGCIAMYLICKCLFVYLMLRITQSPGSLYNMGAFFAVLKVKFVDDRPFGGSGSEDTTLSYWSPLKIGMTEQNAKYEVNTLKLHYKGWK